jgi:hypothetical protein
MYRTIFCGIQPNPDWFGSLRKDLNNPPSSETLMKIPPRGADDG